MFSLEICVAVRMVIATTASFPMWFWQFWQLSKSVCNIIIWITLHRRELLFWRCSRSKMSNLGHIARVGHRLPLSFGLQKVKTGKTPLKSSYWRPSQQFQYSSEHARSAANQNVVGSATKPDIAKIEHDFIGPPDPKSNLRPVLRHIPKNETPLAKKLRLKQLAIEKWNHAYWASHNMRFYAVSTSAFRSEPHLWHPRPFQQKREQFIKANKPEDSDTLTADKMSEFYKEFLDKNNKMHVDYNWLWYRKNFELLSLVFMTKIEKLFARLRM